MLWFRSVSSLLSVLPVSLSSSPSTPSVCVYIDTWNCICYRLLENYSEELPSGTVSPWMLQSTSLPSSTWQKFSDVFIKFGWLVQAYVNQTKTLRFCDNWNRLVNIISRKAMIKKEKKSKIRLCIRNFGKSSPLCVSGATCTPEPVNGKGNSGVEVLTSNGCCNFTSAVVHIRAGTDNESVECLKALSTTATLDIFCNYVYRHLLSVVWSHRAILNTIRVI